MANIISGRPNIVWGDATPQDTGGQFAGYMQVNTSMTSKPYIPDVLSTLGLGAWTVEAWVKVDNDHHTGNQAAIFFADMRSDNTARATVYLQKDQTGLPWGTVKGLVLSCMGKHAPATVEFPTDGTWHHVAFLFDGGEFRLYQDGKLVNRLAGDAPAWHVGDILELASQYANNDSRFNGGYDDIRVTRQARYTDDFTPPATPFANKAMTKLLDPHLPYRRLHIQAEGSEGGSKIEDAFGHVVQKHGQPYISLKQAKVGTGSLSLDRRNPCSIYVEGDDLIRNDNDACYEAWIYITSLVGDFNMIFDTRHPTNDATGFFLTARSDMILRMWSGTGDRGNRDHQTRLKLNTWHHVAVCIANNVARMYLDGEPSDSSIQWGAHTFNQFLLGKSVNADNGTFDGYMDEIKMSIGHAIYGAPFTPSTDAYKRAVGFPGVDANSDKCVSLKRGGGFKWPDADEAGTEWLVHSTNTAWRNSGARGFDRMGAMEFDRGTQSWLECATPDAFNFGQGDFSVEFWMLPYDLNQYSMILNTASGNNDSGKGMFLMFQDERFRFDVGGSGSNYMSGKIQHHVWTHICVERMGDKLFCYTNGRPLRVDGYDISANLNHDKAGICDGSTRFNGMLANFRAYKGVAVHAGKEFTPEWMPAQLTGNTPFPGYGASGKPVVTGVYDFESGHGDMTNVKGSDVVTNEFHWGKKSLVGTVTANLMQIPGAKAKLGVGPFTEEFFVKLDGAQAHIACFLAINDGAVNDATVTIFLLDGKLRISTPGDRAVTAMVDFPRDKWVHVAYTFDGTTYRGYQDGIMVCSLDNHAPVFSANQYIGVSNNAGFAGNAGFKGWIDDIRLTKGLARYVTDTITVPDHYNETATPEPVPDPNAIPGGGRTSALLHFEE